LEFSTIPPYLCALWSVKTGGNPVALSIRTVAREEMLHMGLVCNLLAALGETPQLNKAGRVPVYPGPPPGGVLPQLIIPRQGLTPEAIELFMQIEFPEHGPVALAPDAEEEFTSIGQFYGAIRAAFDATSPSLSPDRQREGPLGLWKLTTLEEVRRAL